MIWRVYPHAEGWQLGVWLGLAFFAGMLTLSFGLLYLWSRQGDPMKLNVPVSLLAFLCFVVVVAARVALAVSGQPELDGLSEAMLLSLGGVLGTAVAVKQA